jgi:hypothetical protein
MAGDVTRRGVDVLQSMGFADRASALAQFRALLWTVVGFAGIEHGARDSVHHTRIEGEHVVYAVKIDIGDDVPAVPGDRPDVVDVDELFANLVEIFVSGLEARLADAAR